MKDITPIENIPEKWYETQEAKNKYILSYPNDYYSKNKSMNVLKTYYENRVQYLIHVMDIPEDKAKRFVKKLIISRKKVPNFVFYDMDMKTKDKHVKNMSLDSYIDLTYSRDDIIVPSFTKYDKHGFSLDSEWIDDKVKERNHYKNLKKKAEQAGNKELEVKYDNNQKTKKTGANSLSGLCSLVNAPIHTFSIHYSLTSITRTSTSTSINLAERMFGGTRGWLDEEDAIEDIILYHRCYVEEDVAKMQEIHNLKVPTPQMVRDFVFEKVISWEHEDFKIGLTKLQKFINDKTDLERVYIFYGMDFMSISKYNPRFYKEFLTDFTRRPIDKGASHDMSLIKKADYNMQNLLYTINNDFIVNSSLNPDTYQNTPVGDVFIGTYKNVLLVTKKYEYFIKSLFKNVYVNSRRLGQTKFMIKNVSALSDTDSLAITMYGVLKKEIDPMILSSYNIRLMAPMMYFLGEKIRHGLTTFTALTNAKEEKYEKIAMKAEYVWSAFIPSQKAKHYTTITQQKEFFVKGEGSIDVSGVHLIGGAMPPLVKRLYEEFREDVVREIEFYGTLNYPSIVKRATALELKVVGILHKTPEVILPLELIKPPDEYAGFEKGGLIRTPSHHKLMYDTYYAKYFNNLISDELPCLFAKVFIKKVSSKFSLDEELHEHLGEILKETKNPMKYFKEVGKEAPSSIRIPYSVLTKSGLPDEWRNNLDTLEILNKSLSAFYTFLASLGLHKTDEQYFFQAYAS